MYIHVYIYMCIYVERDVCLCMFRVCVPCRLLLGPWAMTCTPWAFLEPSGENHCNGQATCMDAPWAIGLLASRRMPMPHALLTHRRAGTWRMCASRGPRPSQQAV